MTEIHVRWRLYCQLFGESQLRFDLMEKTAVTFFARVQRVFLDDVILGIGRLTDPAYTRQNRNFSFPAFRSSLSQSAPAKLLAQIDKRLGALERYLGPFRDHRNKRIAHFDLSTRLDPEKEPLPGISRADVERVFDLLRGVLNDVEVHYSGSSTGYEYVVTNKDGESLVEAMKRAYAFEQLYLDDPVKWQLILDESKYRDA